MSRIFSRATLVLHPGSAYFSRSKTGAPQPQAQRGWLGSTSEKNQRVKLKDGSIRDNQIWRFAGKNSREKFQLVFDLAAEALGESLRAQVAAAGERGELTEGYELNFCRRVVAK